MLPAVHVGGDPREHLQMMDFLVVDSGRVERPPCALTVVADRNGQQSRLTRLLGASGAKTQVSAMNWDKALASATGWSSGINV